jgi:hypothetical protein
VREDDPTVEAPWALEDRVTVDTHSFSAPLKGFGRPPTRAQLVVERLSLRQRLARSASAVGAGVVAALIALPIPLVHFVFVPGAFLAGIALGAVRMRQREIFQSAEAPCPYCATHQRLGLAGRAFRLPREVHCRTCGRALELGADSLPPEAKRATAAPGRDTPHQGPAVA